MFALNHKESGRESVTAILATDTIPASSKVDTKAYLDDFAFPYRAQKQNPLSFFVHSSQSDVLLNGDNIVLQVGLRANNKDFFESETFKQGMLMSAIKRPKIIIKTKKEKIDISDISFNDISGCDEEVSVDEVKILSVVLEDPDFESFSKKYTSYFLL